jgi:multidrug efflux system membrane fusion protein
MRYDHLRFALPLGFLALAACGGDGAPTAPPPAEVLITPAQDRPVSLADELPGRVVAFRTAEIRPQVGGIVQRRLFTEGAMVSEGQPLFQINPAPFRADAASAAATSPVRRPPCPRQHAGKPAETAGRRRCDQPPDL